jgi:hypothetical protein
MPSSRLGADRTEEPRNAGLPTDWFAGKNAIIHDCPARGFQSLPGTKATIAEPGLVTAA